MTMSPRVRIQTEDFDLSTEVAALRAGDAGVGAVASFIGMRKNQVVKMKPGPFAMLHLVGEPASGGRVVNLLQRTDQIISAYNPEHVEAAESI